MSKRWVVVIILFAMGLVVGSPPSAEASLASIGYTVLRWLDRADILHHDLTARIDPPNWSATFTDDVTFQSKGSRSFHILLGKDARIDRITMSDTGERVAFTRTLSLGALPFHIYRIDLPSAPGTEPFALRFEWTIDASTVELINPFIARHFFYIGYASIWYPQMPEESFFTADITILAPRGYLAFSEGAHVAENVRFEGDGASEEASAAEEGWTVHRYQASFPVNGMGIGVGQYRNDFLINVDPYTVQVWRPLGLSTTASQVGLAAARAASFFADRLGPTPLQVFRVVEAPFPWTVSYPGLSNLVYGGELSDAGFEGRDGLALFAAHETAHKWIGSTVGVRLIGGAWLSEGLAEYLGYLALAQIEGSDATRRLFESRTFDEFVQGSSRRALGAIELFDADAHQAYAKGALVMRMLHRRLGTEQFFSAIRSFIAEYSGTHVTGRDFEAWVIRHVADLARSRPDGSSVSGDATLRRPEAWRAWSDPVAPEGVGGDLGAFFNTWIRSNRSLDYELQVDAAQVSGAGVQLTVRIKSVGSIVEPGDIDLEIRHAGDEVTRDVLPLGEERVYHFSELPEQIRIDPDLWLADANPANNVWTPQQSAVIH